MSRSRDLLKRAYVSLLVLRDYHDDTCAEGTCCGDSVDADVLIGEIEEYIQKSPSSLKNGVRSNGWKSDGILAGGGGKSMTKI